MKKVKKVNQMSEYDRYVKAANLVAFQGKSLVEAIRFTGVCIPDFIENAKTVAWPVSPKWSPWFKRTTEAEKLLWLGAMVKE